VAEKATALKQVEQRERETAMSVLASLAGDTQTTARVLEDQYSIFVNADTIQSWRSGPCRDLYRRYQEEYAPKLEEALVREAREVAGRAMILERRLLDETERQLSTGKMNDPAKAAANISRVKQSAIDKLLSLTGRPTTITQHQDAAEIIRALEGRGVLVPLDQIVESTAEKQP
jgi:hypothetical protein